MTAFIYAGWVVGETESSRGEYFKFVDVTAGVMIFFDFEVLRIYPQYYEHRLMCSKVKL
jgi:hypothetical protein